MASRITWEPALEQRLHRGLPLSAEGSYLITGISQRDYPVVQGVVLVIATFFILLNLLTDLMYAWVDPRVSYGN